MGGEAKLWSVYLEKRGQMRSDSQEGGGDGEGEEEEGDVG